MKRILVIANSIFPAGRANSVNVFRMVSAFAKAGLEVWLLARRSSLFLSHSLWRLTCLRYGDNVAVRGLFVWLPLARGAEVVLGLISFFLILFAKSDTLIYTRVRYAAFMATLLRHPTLFESHMPPQQNFEKRIELWMLRRGSTRMIVISQALRDIYEKRGFPIKKIHVLPDGGRALKNRAPDHGDFAGPVRNIGYIGSFYEGRGLDLIVELAGHLPEKNFHLVGKRCDLPASIHHLPENIVFYDEVTPHQAELMTRLFDLLLMPYQSAVRIPNGMDTSQWMSPLKLFEYMLSGRPVISSDHPVLREVLRDSENCLLAPPSDPGAWVKAVKELDDPETRYKLARQAFLDSWPQYTWEKRAQKALELIQADIDDGP